MQEASEDTTLISHGHQSTDIIQIVAELRERIRKEGDKPDITVARQLEILDSLTKFSLGVFLLLNKGLNGFWTHYLLTYPSTKQLNTEKTKNSIESFMLERAPAVLATRQRYSFFLEENQKVVANNKKLACIPSGMMGELLNLNYEGVENIELFGIDYDSETLEQARAFSNEKGLSSITKLMKANAWDLEFINEFDLISSNGLNIYEPQDEKVTQLYAIFFKALKPGGKLVTSFLTYPPIFKDKSEWKVENVNKEDLLLQKVIFVDIIGAKWQCFRTTEKTKQQLQSVGFEKIQFRYDDHCQFPTVLAEKPSKFKL